MMSDFGIRRKGKINTLLKLNKQFNLGLSQKSIEQLSTNQLRKIIFEIKSKNGLTIKKSSKFQLTQTTKGNDRNE
jgi:hypothetical protein